MQVSVERTSELSRKMTVSLPEDMVETKLEERYKSLARTVKIDGFRPGKVPVRVVKKMYSDRVKSEVMSDLIKETYPKALEIEELTPAGHPHINSADDSAGFEYIAEFEVYPEISLEGMSSLEVKRPIATVEQDDIDTMIAKLKDQKKEWNDVERAVENADRVTIHFSGVCEGENFTEGKIEDFVVEIGSDKMIPGFEDELVGLEKGATKTFEVTFPEDYNSEKLAGKIAEFDIEVVKVEVVVLPEIDEEFIKAYGIEDGSIDSFNADVKSNMERELALGLKEKLKQSALDELYEKIQVNVPKVLIDEEVKNVRKPYEANMKKQNLSIDDLDLPNDLFEEQAKRRVVLGMLLGEIIKNNEITVDDTKVRSTIESMSNSYERPQDVIDWYFSDETRLNEVKQMVLEDQTVEWIVDQAQVTEENISFNDVMDKKSN